MSILTGALKMGRGRAEARFTETFTFFRTELVEDENGVKKPTDVVVHADVSGQVKSVSQVVSDREHGAQMLTVQHRVVKIGVGAAPNVRVGDVAEVTASTVDASIVGRRFLIEGIPESGQVTAHRYPVSEAS